jgi:hypothetical protein
MTPITYNYLQNKGFKLLIPIVSQNENPEEVLTMWGKECEDRIIRLEYHSDKTTNTQNDQMPFHPEGLKLFMGERGAPEFSYEGKVTSVEELESYLNFEC